MSQQPTAFPRPAADYQTIPRRTSSDCACLTNKVSSDKKWYKGQWVEKYDNMQTYFIWLPINLPNILKFTDFPYLFVSLF